MWNPLKKSLPTKAESDAITRQHEEAQKRMERVGEVGEKILRLCCDEGITISDFKVISAELMDSCEKVFGSRTVSEFMDKPENFEEKKSETIELPKE